MLEAKAVRGCPKSGDRNNSDKINCKLRDIQTKGKVMRLALKSVFMRGVEFDE